MRTWGRVFIDPLRPELGKVWVKVETDAQGFNDMVYVTTLIQTLKLNLGESPFYAQYGIPAKPSVVQQVFPDFYVWRTQQQYSPFFASLIIAKEDAPFPRYRVNITTHNGVKLNAEVPIST